MDTGADTSLACIPLLSLYIPLDLLSAAHVSPRLLANQLHHTLPHGLPRLPDGRGDRFNYPPSLGALRHGHGHADLREQACVCQLVGAHRSL